MTLRGLPADLARALRREAKRRGTSLNETAKDLLRRGLGLHDDGAYDNGLGRLAGTWSAEEHAAFEEATAGFETVDDELWK
jgi:hypothetical protein